MRLVVLPLLLVAGCAGVYKPIPVTDVIPVDVRPEWRHWVDENLPRYVQKAFLAPTATIRRNQVTAAYVPSLDQTEVTCVGELDSAGLFASSRYAFSYTFTQPGRATGKDWRLGDATIADQIMGVDPKRNRKQ